jgi:hypothetical protein
VYIAGLSLQHLTAVSEHTLRLPAFVLSRTIQRIVLSPEFVGPFVDIYVYIYICVLTAIGLTPGGSSTVHIYTQAVHRIQETEHV